MYELFCIFFLYAFLGWCVEVCYAAMVSGVFSNRGFLNGPYCPIYGFGVLLAVNLLQPLRAHFLLLFLGAVAVTSALELAAGFLLEKLFHQRWWDYTDQPFHLKGYICLRFSIVWGLGCLLAVEVIHPSVQWLIDALPAPAGAVLMLVSGLLMAADLVVCVWGVNQLNRDLGQIERLAHRMREISDELGAGLAGRAIAVSERTDDLRESIADLRGDFADWKDDAAQWREQWSENLSHLVEELQEDFADWRENLTERAQDWKNEHVHPPHQQEELHQIKETLESLAKRTSAAQKRLLHAFPDMHSLRHSGAMKWLRRKGRDSR